MDQVLEILNNLSIIIFVVCSMLTMGLSFTVKEMTKPIANWPMILKALSVNFIIFPLLCFLIIWLMPMDDAYKTGLIILAFAAGAPFIPKLAQISKANVALSVGLMALLMVATIIIVPFALPLLISGVEVSAWNISKSLIILMLIPLAIGTFIKFKSQSLSKKLSPIMNQTSNIGLVVLTLTILILNFDQVIDMFGNGTILIIILLTTLILLTGYFLGGKNKKDKQVFGLSSAQRNISAAIVIVSSNFNDDKIFSFVILYSIVIFIILLLVSFLFGRKAKKMI